jgi:hypothetical protein
MMNRPMTALWLGLGVSATAHAGCETDLDCKGSRVCEEGACVEPDESEREPWVRKVPGGYEINGDFATWGEVSSRLRGSRDRDARALGKRADDILIAGCVLLPLGVGLLTSTPAFQAIDATRLAPNTIGLGIATAVAGTILLAVMPGARMQAAVGAAHEGIVFTPILAPTADGATVGFAASF